MRSKYGLGTQRRADLGDRRGGTMRIGRAIIIPAILALSVAGAVMPGAEIAMAAGHTAGVHIHTTPLIVSGTFFHG